MHRIFSTTVSSVHTHYVNKVEKKGRTLEELTEALCWVTGFTPAELQQHLDDDSTFEEFFAVAPMNPRVGEVTGVVCGVRVENVEDPLMQKIRYLDKVVDELARGKSMAYVTRS